MAYIGHGEGLIGCHEVVVLEVGGDVEPGAGAAGVADERGSGPGAEGDADNPLGGDVAVADDPHREAFADPLQKIDRPDRLGQVPDDAEAHPLLGRGLQQLQAAADRLFADRACGHVLRVKGFAPDPGGQTGWLELNATAAGKTLAPIPQGQDVLIVIGEGLDKAAIEARLKA